MSEGALAAATSLFATRIANSLGSPRPSSLAMEADNRSSLDPSQFLTAEKLLRDDLEKLGIASVPAAGAEAQVAATLSENLSEFLWVGEVRSGNERIVILVEMARDAAAALPAAGHPLGLRAERIFGRPEPVLDFAILPAAGSAAGRLLLLGAEDLSSLTPGTGGWQPSQQILVTPEPGLSRDARGLLQVSSSGTWLFLRGVSCRVKLEADPPLECQPGGEQVPEVSDAAVPDVDPQAGEALLERLQKSASPAQFATVLLNGTVTGSVAALVAGADGRATLYDRDAKLMAAWPDWGSQMTGLAPVCGQTNLLLATRSGDWTQEDSVQAFTIAGNQPLSVSDPIRFDGPVLVLRAGAGGSQVRAVIRDLKTNEYEAYTLKLDCSR